MHENGTRQSAKPELTPISPFAVGGGFLQYCVDHGWIVREGASRKARYFVTPDGVKKLAQFGSTRLR